LLPANLYDIYDDDDDDDDEEEEGGGCNSLPSSFIFTYSSHPLLYLFRIQRVNCYTDVTGCLWYAFKSQNDSAL
jgi:hypothetical protein